MISSLSWLAAKTSRIQLGSGVTPLPLRDPILLAKQVATLDHLSGGRFIFGVGVANKTDKEEFWTLGIPFEPTPSDTSRPASSSPRCGRSGNSRPPRSTAGPSTSRR
jgi:alkanesulfonate monooxygenase SsuD/methylene tetrahydromethanopterin reductase-like flavin-dependent oxidoreductase (luciferase family)